jgi:hypothetical protein
MSVIKNATQEMYSGQLRHNHAMAIRTTVEISEPLYEVLRDRAERSGASIRSLIVRAIEQTYSEPGRREYVEGTLVTGSGKLGPAFPEDENPHDFVFS